MGVLRALWAGWKAVGRRIANVQARVLLSAFYFVVLGPFAVGARLVSDPLAMAPRAGSRWLRRESPAGDPLMLARRQF
jgi:hypothetical protein